MITDPGVHDGVIGAFTMTEMRTEPDTIYRGKLPRERVPAFRPAARRSCDIGARIEGVLDPG